MPNVRLICDACSEQGQDCAWTWDYDTADKTTSRTCPRCGSSSGLSLDALLEDIAVDAPGMWENDDGPKDWYAVGNTDGIIAYFRDEVDAFRFRLDYINRLLNP